MIALPIYLQRVLECNALQAGLPLGPLSLSMLLSAGKKPDSANPQASSDWDSRFSPWASRC